MKKNIGYALAVILSVCCLAGCSSSAGSSASGSSSAAGSSADVSSSVISSAAEKTTEPSIHWSKDTTIKYLNDKKVKSIICVEATSKNAAHVLMFEKTKVNGKTVWTNTLDCDGVIGLDGLGQTREDNCETPIGDWGVIEAFGIKENPGTSLSYVDVTDDTYACGDEVAYNQIIDITEYPHECAGEHMIECTPEYNYGFFLDYNKECVVGNGSAIFFHCKGAKSYTGGCIAVDEENMIQILQAIDENTRVIIDYATEYEE